MNNINLDLIRNFLMEFVPQEHHADVVKLFNEFRADPAHFIVGALLNHQTRYLKAEPIQAVPAFHGIMVGLSLAYSYQQCPDLMKPMLESYLANAAKTRGDNVVNFHQHIRRP